VVAPIRRGRSPRRFVFRTGICAGGGDDAYAVGGGSDVSERRRSIELVPRPSERVGRVGRAMQQYAASRTSTLRRGTDPSTTARSFPRPLGVSSTVCNNLLTDQCARQGPPYHVVTPRRVAGLLSCVRHGPQVSDEGGRGLDLGGARPGAGEEQSPIGVSVLSRAPVGHQGGWRGSEGPVPPRSCRAPHRRWPSRCDRHPRLVHGAEWDDAAACRGEVPRRFGQALWIITHGRAVRLFEARIETSGETSRNVECGRWRKSAIAFSARKESSRI